VSVAVITCKDKPCERRGGCRMVSATKYWCICTVYWAGKNCEKFLG